MKVQMSRPKTMLLLVLALTSSVSGAATGPVAVAPVEAIPSDAAQLRELVAELDRKMFDAYNAHDVDGLMAWFSEDLEFYHDNGGFLDFQQVKSGFTSVDVSVHADLAVQRRRLEGHAGSELRALARWCRLVVLRGAVQLIEHCGSQ